MCNECEEIKAHGFSAFGVENREMTKCKVAKGKKLKLKVMIFTMHAKLVL